MCRVSAQYWRKLDGTRRYPSEFVAALTQAGYILDGMNAERLLMAPLSGLLVVSLEQAVAAPLCSCKLADAGARVIKIERPEGDFARGYDAAVHGLSSYFVWLNRGKQSLAADIKDPADAALLHRILAGADRLYPEPCPGCRRPCRLRLGRATARGTPG